MATHPTVNGTNGNVFEINGDAKKQNMNTIPGSQSRFTFEADLLIREVETCKDHAAGNRETKEKF